MLPPNIGLLFMLFAAKLVFETPKTHKPESNIRRLHQHALKLVNQNLWSHSKVPQSTYLLLTGQNFIHEAITTLALNRGVQQLVKRHHRQVCVLPSQTQ